MRTFEVYNDYLEKVELVTDDEDKVYEFFEQKLGLADADYILGWAIKAEPGWKLDLLPCTPYIIECKDI